MSTSTWYPQTRAQQRQRAESLIKVMPTPKLVSKKENKEKKEMPETTNSVGTKEISKEVFDLGTFDNIRVGAEIKLPVKPASLAEVQQLFGGDEQRLLNIIYDGMCKEAEDDAESADVTWHTYTEDGELSDKVYDMSKSADPDKKKLIDGMILNFAKAAFGFTKNEGRDEKVREANQKAKENARKMIQSNQAMLDSIVNAK